tara:strand:- start:3817 stop:7839 length:4023 start_codon:yes stop_codon:yes gene_type:complete
MALKDLVTDLSNFKYTDYDNAGKNNSQIKHRFGGEFGPTPAQPPLSDEHTKFDDGVGRGVHPNDEPQQFTVRGYQVTGNKRFYIGWQGDLIPREESLYGIGSFNSIAGVFDHTQIRDRLRKAYDNYSLIDFGADGSVHVGNQDLAGVVGGGLNYYGSLVSITPRGSIYRDSGGNYQVPQEGRNTNPPGGISNIPLFEGTQITHNIPQINLTGPFGDEDYQSTLNTIPRVPDAHGSDFMVTPLGESSLPSNTVTHNVDMITLSGPTSQTYQTQINTTPIADGAHGSDFQTTPIEAYSSIFATQDGLLMDTIYDSGFNRGDMYISDQSEPSIPLFKEFSRTDTSLKRISLSSPNFDSDNDKEFTFKDRIPYNIPARDDSTTGFDQPFIIRPIGNTWGFDRPNGEGFFSKVGGFLNEIDSAVGDVTRGAPGFTGLISRTLHDAVRLGKFALTPKGVFFVAKQYAMQLLNPRPETRVYNPLSLASISPIVHVDRHLGGLTYETSPSGPAGYTILDIYSQAIKTGPFAPQWAAAIATRTTLAHMSAMVPSAGGKISLPGIPEIKFDLLSGTIDSLSTNVVGENKYSAQSILGNKEYTVTDGTPIIPARNPEAGFKSGILGGRFAGSQLTEMFLSEDGLFPSEALTDAIIKTGIYEGDLYNRSNAYAPVEIPNKIQDKPGVDSTREERLKKGTIQLGDFAIYKKRYFHTISGEGPVVSIGGRDTLNQNGYMIDGSKTRIGLKRGGHWSSDLYDTDTKYTSLIGGIEQAETEPKDFTTTKLTIDENGEPQLTFSLPYNNLDSEASKNRSLAFNLQTRTGNIRDKKVKLSDYKDFTWSTTNLINVSTEGLKFVGNKYGPPGSQRYGNVPYSKNRPYHKSAGTWGKIPGSGEGEEGVYDWSDLDVGDSVGGLTMVHKEEQTPKRNVRDNPVVEGPQGGSVYPKNIPVNRPQDSSRFENLELPIEGKEQQIPTVVKTKVVQDDNAPAGIEPNPDIVLGDKPAAINVPATSVSPDKKSAKQDVPDQPTGNKEALKRYKTLSYGDLGEGSPKRYNQEWLSGGEHQDDLDDAESQRRKELFDKIKSDRSKGQGLVYQLGNPGTPGVTAVYDDDLGGQIKAPIDGSGKVTNYKSDLTDSINMTPYGEDSTDPDFIKFKFYDIVNKKHIIFRATLNGISETLSPEWSSERYIGRPDNVHVYQGVDRSMSFNFIVAPTTRQELPILWEKLNYLVGLTYPTWSNTSPGGKRMQAPFISLTIGDMYVNTPGYLGGLGVEIDDNGTWEITDGMQLPKVVNISCEFTHIGQHALASQGTHYDLSWLKQYDAKEENWKWDETQRPDKWNDFYSKIGSPNQT